MQFFFHLKIMYYNFMLKRSIDYTSKIYLFWPKVLIYYQPFNSVLVDISGFGFKYYFKKPFVMI